jgi:preprotein translocase subunit SecB
MDKKLIVQASEKLELLDIVLYESNFKRFTESHNQLKLGQQNKLSVRAETGEAIDNENSPINIFRVFVELGIRVNNVSNQEKLYQVEATFRVDYELKNDVNEEALKEFAHFNAVHNVWPFWRQFVFSTTNQAHLPCPEIPLRKLQS